MTETLPAPDYEFKRLDAGRLTDMQRLLQRSFGLKIPLNDIAAKYATQPFGKQYVGYLAYQVGDPQPAAYYGVFPLRFWVGDRTILVAQSGDTMTDPDHRKRGLFTRTAERAYTLAEKEGVQFVFGFPNQYSYPGFKRKLAWEFTGHMRDFSFKTQAIPLAGLAGRFAALRGLYRRWVDRKLRQYAMDFAEAERAFAAPEIPQVHKDAEFFRYKAFSGAVPIRFREFVLYVKVDGQLIVGAVAPFPENKTADFLSGIRQLAQRLGCQKCLFSVSENHWLCARLAGHLESEEGLPIGFRDFGSGLDLSRFVFSRADFDTF
ncbi:MAG: GNAT family N-acetyltransferase [Bacteroidota bacterium]